MRRSLVSLAALVFVAAVMLAGPVARSGAQDATPPAGGTGANKEVVRRFYEIFVSGDFAAFGEIIAADVVDHHPAPGQVPGVEGVVQSVAPFKTGFPDGTVTIDALVAEGDLVVDRVTLRGTHTGDFLGMPATGKAIELSAINMWRIADGKIVEVWHIEDIVGLLTQLGVLPAPPAAAMATPVAPATGTTGTPAENEAIVQRFYDAMNAGDMAELEAVIAADVVQYAPAPAVGRDASLAVPLALRAGFPDFKITVEEMVAEGDLVVSRVVLTGTHTGDFLGIPPTGKAVVVEALEMRRIAGGQIVEVWPMFDQFGLLVQLGVVPAPGGAATPAA